MNRFPDSTHFKYNWRPYQARVLGELEEHLGDSRLHVVAAPGSGKTLLGLQVAVRLNEPTLVFAPTLAIRDQWISRLVKFFLPDEETPEWISHDVLDPKFLTVVTYQALYMACGGHLDEFEDLDEESDSENNDNNNLDFDLVVDHLKSKKIGTIILDEAHHLRANWWKTLSEVISNLGEIRIVSLTATPPYDVSIFEWERYIQLCGPVDTEVSIPELVKEGNLCPHQDLVILTAPSFLEDNLLKDFRNSVDQFVEDLRSNDAFLTIVKNHKWTKDPTKHIDEILENPEYFSSLLVFLKDRKVTIPEESLELVGGQHFGLPSLDREWIEILLEGILFPPDIKARDLDPALKAIKNRLFRIDVLERRRVNLSSSGKVDKTLKRSITKLHAILTITKLEKQVLGNNLRMVILTDFIRKAYLPTSESDIPELDRIGVVPIFEFLRREQLSNCKFGVLSGSLIILPEDAKSLLYESANICKIEKESIQVRQLPFDGYFEVELKGSDSQRKVQLITEILMKGGVQVLIGTKSLLGEGWDAPVVNSLILATFVGSYMLSNQMRGRAIRTDPNEPDKTSNIWHLICVETGTKKPGTDYETMRRRFRAFLGVSFTDHFIENGFDRLGIGQPPFTEETIRQINQSMAEHASSRNQLKEAWQASLRMGDEGIRLVEEVKTKKTRLPLPRGFVFRNTLEALFWQLFLLAGLFVAGRLPGLIIPLDIFELTVLSYVPFLGFLIFSIRFFPKFAKGVWMFIKHGPIKSSIKQVGRALLYSLCQTGIVKNSFGNMDVIVEENKRGEVFCHIEGGTRREMSIYLESLEEILGPVESPRYILVRKSIFRDFLTRYDYHSVPSILGIRKEFAEIFADSWTKFVGEMKLVYTRSREGRLILIKARNHSLSAGFRKSSERVSRWK